MHSLRVHLLLLSAVLGCTALGWQSPPPPPTSQPDNDRKRSWDDDIPAAPDSFEEIDRKTGKRPPASVLRQRKKWRQFLRRKIQIGDSLKEVDAILKGQSRDTGRSAAMGTGAFQQYYLIDDFLQIAVMCDLRETVLTSWIEPAERWCKFPGGQVSILPNP